MGGMEKISLFREKILKDISYTYCHQRGFYCFGIFWWVEFYSNTPAQIVIGGEVEAVDYAVELLKEAGVRKLIELKVSGPFHTAILKPASEKLALELDKIDFRPFELPLISNTSAKVMENDEVKGLLTRQVMEPVRFYESVETMQKLGATRFIEVGPGRVLSGFIKKIDKNAEIANVENLASFEALINQ